MQHSSHLPGDRGHLRATDLEVRGANVARLVQAAERQVARIVKGVDRVEEFVREEGALTRRTWARLDLHLARVRAFVLEAGRNAAWQETALMTQYAMAELRTLEGQRAWGEVAADRRASLAQTLLSLRRSHALLQEIEDRLRSLEPPLRRHGA